jgi:cell division protein FtsL
MTGVTMADEKAQPTFVITTPQAEIEQPKKTSRLTRKHILIAAVSLAIAVLVVVVVLVAIRIYTDHETETLKLQYSMKMKDKDNQDVSQNVSADANANIVQYDIQKDGVKATILHDFDKGIAISRVESESGVACFLAALNRSSAQEPTEIPSTAPTPSDKTPTTQLVYRVDNKPIKDLTFLGKRASTLCANVPTHWMVPSCQGDENGLTNSTTTTPATASSRKKRATVCATCGGYYCVCGCCNAICGSFASSSYTWYYSNGVYYCTYYMYYVSCRVSLAPNNCYLNGVRYYYPWS